MALTLVSIKPKAKSPKPRVERSSRCGRRGGEFLAELRQRLVQLRFEIVVENLFLGDGREHARAMRVEEAIEPLFVRADALDRNRVEEAVRRGVDDRHLLLDRQRPILRLL